MNTKWQPPEGHPISKEQAIELISGEYGDYLGKLLERHCAPIYWYPNFPQQPDILHNGTVTIVKTSAGFLGITAAHVILAYEREKKQTALTLQIGNLICRNIDIIDLCELLDIATIAITENDVLEIGHVDPISIWPPQIPGEQSGILLGGYPGKYRRLSGPHEIEFGFFTALCVSRRVTGEQITWVPERENMVKTKIADLPPYDDLGGISGGPIIAGFETKSYLQYFKLAGIITEANADLENVIGKRADFIRDDGTIYRSK